MRVLLVFLSLFLITISCIENSQDKQDQSPDSISKQSKAVKFDFDFSQSKLGQEINIKIRKNTPVRFVYDNSENANYSYFLEEKPMHGKLESCFLNKENSFECSYIPEMDFVGKDSFTIQTTEYELFLGATTINIEVVGNDYENEDEFKQIQQTLATGGYGSCQIKNSEVYCWGRSDLNKAQTWNNSNFNLERPTLLAEIDFDKHRPKILAKGTISSCLVTENNKVFCWGVIVGGDYKPAEVDTSVISSNIVAIDLVDTFVCLSTEDYRLYCFDSTQNKTLSFQEISLEHLGSVGVQKISVGSYQSCIIDLKGKIICLPSGELKAGIHFCRTGKCSKTPSAPKVLFAKKEIAFKSISVNKWGHGQCAITSLNEIYCWGDAQEQCLNTVITEDEVIPINTNLNLNSIKRGSTSLCVLSDTAVLYCMGSNNSGQLGIDFSGCSKKLNKVDFGGTEVKEIDLGVEHGCVLTTKDQLYCWGHNGYGQLGNGIKCDSPGQANTCGESEPELIY